MTSFCLKMLVFYFSEFTYKAITRGAERWRGLLGREASHANRDKPFERLVRRLLYE